MIWDCNKKKIKKDDLVKQEGLIKKILKKFQVNSEFEITNTIKRKWKNNKVQGQEI